MHEQSTNQDRIDFPKPGEQHFADVVHWGGSLSPENLYNAYAGGIFPWPADDLPLPWCSPDPRAVLEFDHLHVPKTLQRAWRSHRYRLSIDEAFPAVIRACSESPRPGQEGTWITEEILGAFERFHELGHAHSIEVWEGEALVGGLYGVSIRGAFSGESMFHRKSNTSKLALLHLVEHCRSRGLDWIDIQMLTPLFDILGGTEIPRSQYLKRLRETHERGVTLFS